MDLDIIAEKCPQQNECTTQHSKATQSRSVSNNDQVHHKFDICVIRVWLLISVSLKIRGMRSN